MKSPGKEDVKYEYLHKIQYYETDKMGVVHHSNYIRFFEEARTDFFEKTGMGYDIIEKNGLIVPVLNVECNYKASSTYGETLKIQLKMIDFNGIKFGFEYTITSENGKTLHATGKTRHCFLGKDFKPVLVKKTHPEIYTHILNLL